MILCEMTWNSPKIMWNLGDFRWNLGDFDSMLGTPSGRLFLVFHKDLVTLGLFQGNFQVDFR
mgnify:CR=1 FL=1